MRYRTVGIGADGQRVARTPTTGLIAAAGCIQMNVPAGVPLGVQLIVVEVFPLASLMLASAERIALIGIPASQDGLTGADNSTAGVVPPMNKLSNTSSSPTSPFTVTLGAALTVSKPLEGRWGG